MTPQEKLSAEFRNAITNSRGPGAVAYVGDSTETLFFQAEGARQTTPVRKPVTADTIYDLASLTKVVATTSAVMLLREEGKVDLDEPVDKHVPIPAFGAFTIRHLLTHTSGLVAGKPYYKQCSSLDEMLLRYAEGGVDWKPGTRRRYSDVGFMILGKVVELAAGDSLDAFCKKRIFEPLDMKDTAFTPPAAWADRCAATERCAWRRKVIVGAVHDENASAIGGVAGHAGLFSTAEDLARFCRALLADELLKKETLDEMTKVGQTACYPWQGLGWLLDPWASNTDGFLPARAAFGHSGWTGTSLWADRATGLFAILLGNTCHPSRSRRNNRAFRQTFYTAVAESYFPDTTNVHTGLDRLMKEEFEPLRGKRVALLTNNAAVDQLGRHILDVFALAPDVKLHVLYSPEHGLRGQAEAGAKVESEGGGTPVISLYGERKAPTQDELAEVDYFVIDLQDVGSRYYTYAATMKACMKACVAAGTPVIVLDRPNPVGGAILEGPIAVNASSFTCWAPVPIRHGMTLGELAVFFLKEAFGGKGPKLTVKTADNWRRNVLFDSCSLPWVPPSPNIPSSETALAYVGMCLFEGTNLNEGRGTSLPFLVVGAPWLDAAAVVESIDPAESAGFTLDPNRYVPKSLPGKAENPRYKDQACSGIRLRIVDPLAARPFTLALALISAIRRTHPDQFEWGPSFDVLTGSSELRERIEAGESAGDIVASFEPALLAFDKSRPKQYA